MERRKKPVKIISEVASLGLKLLILVMITAFIDMVSHDFISK